MAKFANWWRARNVGLGLINYVASDARSHAEGLAGLYADRRMRSSLIMQIS